MALLFLLSTGSAERDAVLAAAADATALLAGGSRRRGRDRWWAPRTWWRLSAVQAAVEAAAAVGVADGVEAALFDDTQAALLAVSALLGMNQASLR